MQCCPKCQISPKLLCKQCNAPSEHVPHAFRMELKKNRSATTLLPLWKALILRCSLMNKCTHHCSCTLCVVLTLLCVSVCTLPTTFTTCKALLVLYSCYTTHTHVESCKLHCTAVAVSRSLVAMLIAYSFVHCSSC